MIVLAGLPFPNCAAVGEFVEHNYANRPKVVFQGSDGDDGNLYRQSTVEALIRAVNSYAQRQKKAGEALAMPDHVILAYVPGGGEEYLLSEFEFFVFPIALRRLADFDHYGRQLRHDQRIAKDNVLSYLQDTGNEFSELKRKLSTPSEREPLILPPNNFAPTKSTRMANVFAELYRRRPLWNGAPNEIQTTKVSNAELRKLSPGVSKMVFKDSRGLLFPVDRSHHGRARQLPDDASIQQRKLFLRSCFRFGVRLTEGFHHDVQFPGRSLGGVQFECSDLGSIPVEGTHANVYPNDHVGTKNKSMPLIRTRS